MNNALLYIGGILIVLLAAAFAGPVFVDWNRYRDVFEAKASEALGREVRVSGAMSVRLLPTPTMHFEKLRIADPAAGFGEPLIRAESFTIWLAVAPLLRGNIEATDVELTRPVVRLAEDGKGGGNWQTLGRLGSDQASPYLPRDLALQSVRITDGVVVLAGVDGNERGRVEGVVGELAAPALEGPYRVRATLKLHGQERELRLATAKPEAGGAVRFRATLVEAGGGSWTLDGAAMDLAGRTRLEGELGGRLPMRPGAVSAIKVGDAKGQREAGDSIDFKSRVAADSNGFQLSDLALSLDQDGRQQVVAGEVVGDWRAALRIDTRLAAKWLDLDRLAGAPAGDGPVKALLGFLGRLAEFLPESGTASHRVTIDQASIGGDIASGVTARIVRNAGDLALERLEAALPGNSRIDAKGSIVPGRQPRFDGDVQLRGTSLPRFLAWAARGMTVPELRGEGTFQLRSEVTLTSGELALRKATLEIGGSRLGGTVRYRWASRPDLDLNLEADAIDLGRLRPGALKAGELVALLGASGVEVKARLQLGRVLAGEQMLRDVIVDAATRGGVLELGSLRFETDDGLAVSTEGRIAAFASKPKGRLAGLITADTPAAVTSLLRLLDLADAAPRLEAELGAMAPLRLAPVLHIGRRLDGATELDISGTTRVNRLDVTGAMDGPFADWRRSPLDLRARIAGNDIGGTLRTLLQLSGDAARPLPGTLLIKATGPSVAALQTLVAATTPAGQATYAGRLSRHGDIGDRWDGTIDLATPDVAAMLGALGVERAAALQGLAVHGVIGIRSDEAALHLDGRGLTIGGATVAGNITLAGAPIGVAQGNATPRPRRVDGRLQVDNVGLGALLALITAARHPAGVVLGASPPDTIWSERPFDLALLNGVGGRIRLDAGTLSVAEGLSLAGASLEAELAPGVVDLKSLAGRALGGTVSGTFRLEKTTAGAVLAGRLALAKVRLEQLGADADGKPIAAGEAGLAFTLSGRAASPAGMAAVLTGKGTLDLGPATLDRLAPSIVAAVADDVLAGKVGEAHDGLEVALRARLGQGRLTLGPRRVPIEIADGALKVKTFTVETAEGRVATTSTIDLASLRIDSEWRLQSRGGAGSTAPRPGRLARSLPVLPVVLTARLGALNRLEARFDTAALARELAVLRMEREVEDLERLRRLDEDQAQQDGSRQLQLEQQRAAERARIVEPTAAAADALPASTEPGAPLSSVGEPGAPLATAPGVPAPKRRVQAPSWEPTTAPSPAAKQKQREIFDRAFGSSQ